MDVCNMKWTVLSALMMLKICLSQEDNLGAEG